jgi:hypothetical protein
VVFAVATFVSAVAVARAPAGLAIVAVGAVVVVAAVHASRSATAAALVAEPNELRADRLEEELDRLFERVDRLPTDALETLAVRPIDEAAHADAVERGLDAVARLRRTSIFDRAAAAIEREVPLRLSAGSYFSTGVAGVGGHLSGADRVLLTRTLRDAALAVIAREGLDAETYDELIGPCRDLVAG